MTDEQMRVAIAKEMGWALHHDQYCAVPNAQGTRWARLLFDPLEDRNAVQLALEAKIDPHWIDNFADYLDEILREFWIEPRWSGFSPQSKRYAFLTATPRQQWEAWLKTLKLWTD